jgi:Flp pilus assembly protein TadD
VSTGAAQERRSAFFVSALLALAVLAVFGRVAGHGFLTYDDNEYVTGNAEVRSGLTLHGIAWAFTATQAHNWHPLTWISHMLDVQVYGLDPAGHHVTSVLLHAVNTVLLFLFLRRLTRATWRSALVAALFGIHPLHVESVAWIAERKDVLSTLFMMVTLLLYARWTERGDRASYVAVVAAFALGLLSKPMLVTLPVLLLLVDFWPMGRGGSFGRRLVEKLPLFGLSLASSLVTVWAQQRGGAVKTLQAFSLGTRAANADVSYVRYLRMAIWPKGLAVFYPHPGTSLSAGEVVVASAILVAITAAAVALRKARPYVVFGWAWYVVTLLPVIGLIQVGDQAMADRYTYVPLIGPFVAVVWGAADALGRRRVLAASPRQEAMTGAVACGLVGVLGSVAWIQAGVWRDTTTLFEHAIRVTHGNYRAEQVLGDGFAVRGEFDRAAPHYREALRIRPGDRIVMANLASISLHDGRFDEAVALYRELLRAEPGNAAANYNLGNALARQGQARDAIVHYRAAIGLDPGLSDAYRALAWALYGIGDYAGAREQVRVGSAHGLLPPKDLLDRLAAGGSKP